LKSARKAICRRISRSSAASRAGFTSATRRERAAKNNSDNTGRPNLRFRFKATHVVLAMLCAMYFITYVDRVNIGTAAS
jgi:hypothetical protein